MLNIFCVKVGTRYPADYVHKLRAMFSRSLRIPFSFFCVSDQEEDLFEPGRCPASWLNPAFECWGWWNLQEAYSNPRWAKGFPILYVGLDTVITGDITNVIVDRISARRLTLMHDFSYLLEKTDTIFVGTWADGITFIPAGGVPVIWDTFLKEHRATGVGNTDFPMHVFNTDTLRANGITPDIWQEIAPGFITSYKWPSVKLELPPEPVICFHGEPRPAEAAKNTSWILDHWRE